MDARHTKCRVGASPWSVSSARRESSDGEQPRQQRARQTSGGQPETPRASTVMPADSESPTPASTHRRSAGPDQLRSPGGTTERKVLLDRVQEFRGAADEGARHVQTSYLTFLFLGAYVAVIIGSTTDEQLLKVSPVVLPLLNVGLPIIGFYTLIPWLLLLLHFNLLTQFYLLARTLRRLDAAIHRASDDAGDQEHRDLLFPFAFSHMLIGFHHGRLMRFLFALVVWVTTVLFPLVLLTWTQLRFLPFHHVPITWSQRAAVGVDIVLLWSLWPLIVAPDLRARQWWARTLPRPFQWGRRAWMTVSEVSHRLLRVTAVSMDKDTPRSIPRVPRSHRARGFLILSSTSVVTLLLSIFVAVLPDERIEAWVADHVPEPWLSKVPRRDGRRILTLTFLLFDAPRAPVQRNMRLSEKVLVLADPSSPVIAALKDGVEEVRDKALEQLSGLNLVNRDLRLADFRYAIMPKVDLRGANLRGADFTGAILTGANLQPLDVTRSGHCVAKAQERRRPDPRPDSTFRGSPGQFCVTSLQAASLRHASLRKAQLDFARLDRADLAGADLRSAWLYGANLQGTHLETARFEGATLDHAELQGAVLIDGLLHGAQLKDARLHGADLSGAQLVGANLENAQLYGANLFHADLQGAILKSTGLQATILAATNLRGADLREARVGGASVEYARTTSRPDLTLTDLRKVSTIPLTEATYGRLEKHVHDHIDDNDLRMRVLKRFRSTTDHATAFKDTDSAQDALCGKELVLAGCLPEEQSRQYDEKLASFLAQVGCRDVNTARGISVRASPTIRYFPSLHAAPHSRTTLFVMADIARGEQRRRLPAALATLLLDSTCQGAAALPEWMKTELRTVAKSTDGRAAAPGR
jgi:uncharacterized protein YjbI with pentapeptide repeats